MLLQRFNLQFGGLDQGDVPLLLAVLSEKQCKDTLVQALLKD
jgi:hypothetical protein